MRFSEISETIVSKLRDHARRGLRPPSTPDVADMWDLLEGDGELTLLLTLEYLAARRELFAVHGTEQGYSMFGCRCHKCGRAHKIVRTAEQKTRNARRRARYAA